MVGAHAVGVAVAGHLPLRRHRVLSVRQPVEQGFRQSHRPARSVDPGQRPRPLLIEFLRHHHAHVVPAVVGEGEPFAAVEVVKLTVAPAQGVPHPASRAAHFLLDQGFHPIAVANALCHLAFPVAFQISQKATSLFVAEQAVHFLVVALQAQLHSPIHEGGGQSSSHLPTALRPHIARGRKPQIGRQTQALVGQKVHVLNHVGIAGLEGPSRREFPIQRQARLQAEIGGVFHVQHGTMGADVDGHVLGHVNLILDVEELLKTDEVALTYERVQWVLLPKIQLELQRPRRKLVARHIASKPDEMAGIGRKIHVDFRSVVLDAGPVQGCKPRGGGVGG